MQQGLLIMIEMKNNIFAPAGNGLDAAADQMLFQKTVRAFVNGAPPDNFESNDARPGYPVRGQVIDNGLNFG